MSKTTLSKTIKMIENDCIIYLIKMNVISSKIIASITLHFVENQNRSVSGWKKQPEGNLGSVKWLKNGLRGGKVLG